MIRKFFSLFSILFLLETAFAGKIVSSLYQIDCRNEKSFAQWPAAKKHFDPSEGGSLSFQEAKPSLKGTLISLPLPEEKVNGKRIQVSCEIRGREISKPMRTYLGPKIMLVCPMPEQTYYWDFTRRYGSFDWSPATLSIFVPADAKKPALALGLQGSSGLFQIRNLKIETIEDSTPEVLPPQSGKPYLQKTRFRGVMTGHDLSENAIRELGENWGANLVRYQIVNFKKIKFKDFPEYCAWLDAELARLDSLLPCFAKYGVKVLIDLHSGPMNQQNNLLHNALNLDPAQQKLLVDVWKKIAARYRGRPEVWGYDILNEPREDAYVYTPNGGDDWNALSAKVAHAIREIDPDTPIIVEPAMVGNPEGLRSLKPIPEKNMVYSVHFYKPSTYTFQGIFRPVAKLISYPGMIDGKHYDKEQLRRELLPVIDFQKKYQVPIYIGEFSVIRWAPNAGKYLSDLIDLFEEYGWDWTYHAFREWSGWSVEHSDDPAVRTRIEGNTARKRVLIDALRRNHAPRKAENPLGLREYRQEVQMTFDTESEARQVKLTAQPLPADYQLAVTSRWDDASPNHLKTHKIMTQHHCRGTFFLNTPSQQLQKDIPNYCAQLLQGGNSIGLHTATHPMLTALDSNEQFREFMSNRILLETLSQTPVNSQVLPFCDWRSPFSLIPASVGRSMRTAGVLASPDVFYPSGDRQLGYPPGTLALAKLLTPGDRDANLDRFEKQLKAALHNSSALKIQPAISMSMHSWHTPEGLQNLDKIYAKLASNPAWWQCNLNEYGAYRYEALNTRVSKKIQDKTAIFSITRIVPGELGACVPLWFRLAGGTPKTASTGKLHQEKQLELPHSAEQTLPSRFGRTKVDGSSEAFPSLQLKLVRTGERTWEGRLTNGDAKPLTNLEFSFRFPPAWNVEIIRRDIPQLLPGKAICVSVEQPLARPEDFFRYGAPYFALQLDFTLEGKRNRLYAELSELANSALPPTADHAASIYEYPRDGKIDLAKFSQPGAAAADFGLKQETPALRIGVGPGAIYPTLDRKRWGGKEYLAMVEFTPTGKGALTLFSTADAPHMKSEIWLNGQRIRIKNQKITFAPLPGRNRLVLRSPGERWQQLHFEETKGAAVRFLLPAKQGKDATSPTK
ncbi:MAG: cellulase family glycosylhydrolase [Victivallaceae bacterium]|nr:cellulase family glycosylhydrolase [Victivallaceae bacterium]